jgi:hypothetical protein
VQRSFGLRIFLSILDLQPRGQSGYELALQDYLYPLFDYTGKVDKSKGLI